MAPIHSKNSLARCCKKDNHVLVICDESVRYIRVPNRRKIVQMQRGNVCSVEYRSGATGQQGERRAYLLFEGDFTLEDLTICLVDSSSVSPKDLQIGVQQRQNELLIVFSLDHANRSRSLTLCFHLKGENYQVTIHPQPESREPVQVNVIKPQAQKEVQEDAQEDEQKKSQQEEQKEEDIYVGLPVSPNTTPTVLTALSDTIIHDDSSKKRERSESLAEAGPQRQKAKTSCASACTAAESCATKTAAVQAKQQPIIDLSSFIDSTTEFHWPQIWIGLDSTTRC
eukprot:TRINITY_DN7590_c0_g1_i1.p1 TRINITY_DN7590_c0_g1~~TRINITY_DN7590_c0_g1_i1.p1  ORF type:complete len:283 (+),score=54.00 TRINITY_DN7590_c0_g1_i1:3-851(+)